MATLYEELVPDLGDFDDVEVIEVLVSVGQSVEPEDPLVTLETDKASMDIPATRAGKVVSIAVAVGDSVSQGGQIVTIELAVGDSVTQGSQIVSVELADAGDDVVSPAPDETQVIDPDKANTVLRFMG